MRGYRKIKKYVRSVTIFVIVPLLCCSQCWSQEGEPGVNLLVAAKLDSPVQVIAIPDKSGRVALAQHNGEIKVFRNGKVERRLFASLEDVVDIKHGPGLFGISFPPDYPKNNHMFAYYTDQYGDRVVSSFVVEDDGNVDEDTVTPLAKFVLLNPLLTGGTLNSGTSSTLFVGVSEAQGKDNVKSATDSFAAKVLTVNTDLEKKEPSTELASAGISNPTSSTYHNKLNRLFISDCKTEHDCKIKYLDLTSQQKPPQFMDGPTCEASPCAAIVGPIYRSEVLLPELKGMLFFADGLSGIVYAAKQLPDDSWKTRRLFSVKEPLIGFASGERDELYMLTKSGRLFGLSRSIE